MEISKFIEDLKKYFTETPKEEIIKAWEKVCEKIPITGVYGNDFAFSAKDAKEISLKKPWDNDVMRKISYRITECAKKGETCCYFPLHTSGLTSENVNTLERSGFKIVSCANGVTIYW